MPADAVIPTRNGLPQTYKRIPRHVKAVQADFVLDRQAKHENYTVLMVADPQVRTFGVDNSMETWHDRVAPGVTSGEIRVTDLFGNVYTEKITW